MLDYKINYHILTLIDMLDFFNTCSIENKFENIRVYLLWMRCV